MDARHRSLISVWSLLILAKLVWSVGAPDPAHAAVGDLLRTINLPPAAHCSNVGTSVAMVPGASVGRPEFPVLLVMSCWSDSKLFFVDPSVTDPTVPVLTVTTTTTTVGPFGGWGSLALRGDKGDLLACANKDASGNLGIYRIPLSRSFATDTAPTTAAVFLFNGSPGNGVFACDGIAWDSITNRIYQSPDVFDTVLRFTEAGIDDGSFPISANCNFLGHVGASGIAIGGQSLFYACDGDLEIFQVDKTNGTVIRSFSTAGQRTEDLECDPVTFGGQEVDAIWSKDAFTNQIFAFEIPKGTCGLAGGAPVAVPAGGPLCQKAGAPPGTIDLTDTDGDGLLDCWERPSPLSAGANGKPCIDYDGDGICDYVLCTTLPSGTEVCADPYRKDVFVEIDWLVNHFPTQEALSVVATKFGAATTVTNPTNPTTGQSVPGIVLHLQIDPQPLKDAPGAGGNTIPHNHTGVITACGDATPPQFQVAQFTNQYLAFEPYTGPPGAPGTLDFDALKAINFGTLAERTTGTPAEIEKRLNAKRQAFRYAIIGHFLNLPAIPAGTRKDCPDTTSGVAEVRGNDFVVTLGARPTLPPATPDTSDTMNPLHIAGTFMHELGHTLGLRHGGSDFTNCKPNYLSVMSYSRQFPDAPIEQQQWLTTGLNYSVQPLSLLTENNLNETAGIGIAVGTSTDVTVFGCPTATATTCPFSGAATVVAAAGGIDWNRNQNPTDNITSPTNINRIVGLDGTVMCDGTGDGYSGFDDWRSLKYDIRSSLDFADGVRFSLLGEDRELPTAVAEAISPDRDGDGIPDFNESNLILVLIDVKPGTFPKTFNQKSEGTIQVAVLGSDTFDVTQVNPSTIVLSGAPAKKCKVKDVNGDAFADLLCEVESRQLTLPNNPVVIGVLTGRTFSNRPIRGEDTVFVKKGP